MPRKRKSNDFYNNEEVQSNSLFDSPAFNTDTADNVKNDTVKEGTSLTDTAYKNAETTSVNQENSSLSSEAVTFTEVTETAAIETAEETTDKKKKKKVSKSSTESHERTSRRKILPLSRQRRRKQVFEILRKYLRKKYFYVLQPFRSYRNNSSYCCQRSSFELLFRYNLSS
mgnify:CR=1 FL=1